MLIPSGPGHGDDSVASLSRGTNANSQLSGQINAPQRKSIKRDEC